MSHPYVETDYMTYSNSDGSGPNIIEDFDDPQSLIGNLIKYYGEFLNNEHH